MLFSAAIVSIRPSTCSRFGSTHRHHLSRSPSAFHDDHALLSRRKRFRESTSCRRILNVRGGSDGEEDGQDDDGSELLEAQAQSDGSGDETASDTPVIDVSIMNGPGDYETGQEEESSSEEEGTTATSEASVTIDAAEPDIAESEEHDSQSIDEDDQRASAPDPNEESESDLSEIIGDLQCRASDRRAEGKKLHDAGNLSEAAAAFHAAATLLDEAIEVQQIADAEADGSVSLERATCRLHEALCLLKDGRPEECIAACSDVLQDGVRVVAAGEVVGADPDDPEAAETAKSVVVEPAASKRRDSLPPQIRARALHRRAKARLAVDDLDGALEDARGAAFMGDRNAVQFYGRLMREGPGVVPEGGDAGGAPSLFGLMPDPSSSTNPFLEGLMGSGGSPAAPPGGDFSASLLSSLLSGDGGGDGPFGLMGDLLSPPREEKRGRRRGKGRKRDGGGGGGGMDTLAKSVLSNLLKKIEDEETQEKICSYLRSANAQQIMSFAAMAGMPLRKESAERLASFANGVTPRGIGRGVSRVKRGLSIVKTVRRVMKVIDKYKSLIILAVLCYWIRMAMLDNSSYARKAARGKVAQQAAFGLLALPKIGRAGQRLDGLASGGLRLTPDDGGLEDGPSGSGGIEEEIERLQNQLTLIGAIEERNRAQLGSFVDEQDQWDSLDEEEREFLSSKDSIVTRMEQLSEELVLLFLGQKMKNG